MSIKSPHNSLCLGIFFLVFLLSHSSNALDILYEEIPVVLTPTRLKQSLADTPASVTVISKDTITALGVRNITDVLNLVPGMTVNVRNGGDTRVTYHSGNRSNPRRLQVLVDGIAIYEAWIAEVNWSLFPVPIQNIERIEVTRSPSTPAYGNNAFNGVINIITQHPEDSQGINMEYLDGGLNTNDWLVRFGHRLGSTHYRLTLDGQKDSGIDFSPFNEEGARDNRKIRRFNLYTSTAFDHKNSVDLFIRHNDGKFLQIKENEHGVRDISFPDVSLQQRAIGTQINYHATDHSQFIFKSSYHQSQQNQDRSTCIPIITLTEEFAAIFQLDSSLTDAILAGIIPVPDNEEELIALDNFWLKIAELGGLIQALSETCGNTNQDIEANRLNIELQNTYSFSNQLRLVSTLGHRDISAESETFLRDKASNKINYAAANIEYKPIPELTLNIGGILESESYSNTEFSPRLGVNFHINPRHTLRFIYSKAIRTPDIAEQEIDFRYTLRNLSIPVDGATTIQSPSLGSSTGNLNPERIRDYELGYYGHIYEEGLSFDIKLFDEQMRSLISNRLSIRDFDVDNNSSVDIQGLEMELHYQPIDKLQTRFTYVYFDHEYTNEREYFLAIKQSFSSLIHYRFKKNWQASLIYYHSEPKNNYYKNYEYSDMNINYRYAVTNQINIKANFRARHYFKDNSFDKGNLYEDETQYYLGLGLEIKLN